MIWLLASIGVVVFGAGVAWLLLGPLARRAARPYITASTTAADDLESLTKIRSTLLQAAQGVVVVGGVLFTAGTLLYTASSVRLAQQSVDATRDGQVTDRYTSAIEDLGSTNMDVRIGGMYALQRIGEDSPHDMPTVVRVLAAFVRDHGVVHGPSVLDDEETAVEVLTAVTPLDGPKADLRHANLSHLQQPAAQLLMLDLSGADLSGADLLGAHLLSLTKADLSGAQLTDATLLHAELESADLTNADLTDADLTSADLKDASLKSANLFFTVLKDAVLEDADLEGASLQSVDLSSADVTSASLKGADLRNANLQGADLSHADLSDADLKGADLKGAVLDDSTILTGAVMPDGTKHP